MNVYSLPGASAPKQFCIDIGGRREPVTKLVIAPSVFGSWAIIAHVAGPSTAHSIRQDITLEVADPGNAHRIRQASLRTIILEVEQLAAQYPEIEINTGYLSPYGIRGYEIEDVWVRGSWWPGTRRAPKYFANAQWLYLYLRGGFYPDGMCWVKEDGDRRLRLYRTYWELESMTAWEIAEYRMEHGTEVHPELQVPAGTCPRCLSRYVAIPEHGASYHCLECHYEHAD